MNQELLQFYIHGLSRKWFRDDSSAKAEVFKCVSSQRMNDLEIYLGKNQYHNRQFNPEFQLALKIFDTPLMKALS